MISRKTLKYSFSAISTGLVCAGLVYCTLLIFFPPQSPAKISLIAFLGALSGFALGIYTGWRWTQNLAESIIGDILIKGIVWAFAAVGKTL